ncbi:hydrolase [Pseudomonadota bacterium]
MALECGCPEHFPDWDGQDIDLGGNAMLALPMPTFLHMPMGYEVYLGRVRHLLKELDLTERWPGFMLSKTGWFRGQILSPLESSDSPSRHVIHMQSPLNVRAKLHNGDIGSIKNSVREMQSELLDMGRMPKDLYLSYLTCPNCQEKRGGAKIMVIRRWEQSTRLSKRINK